MSLLKYIRYVNDFNNVYSWNIIGHSTRMLKPLSAQLLPSTHAIVGLLVENLMLSVTIWKTELSKYLHYIYPHFRFRAASQSVLTRWLSPLSTSLRVCDFIRTYPTNKGIRTRKSERTTQGAGRSLSKWKLFQVTYFAKLLLSVYFAPTT